MYPKALKERGVESVVQLRFENGHIVRVAGDADLADAAEANLKTWRYDPKGMSPGDVTYRYVLRSAADCATDPRDTVSAREDGQITVTGCRP